MPARTVALVAVEGCLYGFDKLFSYVIPPSLENRVLPGCRVTVPFGRGNTVRNGMVMSIASVFENTEKIKDIIDVPETVPILNDELLYIVHWLHDNTFCTYYDAVRCVLPKGIAFHTQRRYFLCEDGSAAEPVTPEEQKIISLLQSEKNGLTAKKIQSLWTDDCTCLLRNLVKKGILTFDDGITVQGGAKTQTVLIPADESQTAEQYDLTEKQSFAYSFLCDAGQATVKEICYYTGCSAGVVSALLKKGVVLSVTKNIDRSFSARYTQTVPQKKTVTLSEMQKTAWQTLRQATVNGQYGVSLLFGVTGSGKTAVYLSLIESVLRDGKNVIVLVPEISLTPQTLTAFSELFGNDIAVLHSNLSLGERYDEWMRIRSGEARIVIGTRSAVFAPLENIGLIVIDEEQEHTYKSEMSPRYHATAVAKVRCRYHHAQLLLTSATPSMESYANALAGHYRLCELPSRFGSARLPDVKVVDMTDSSQKDAHYLISKPLASAIEKNLDEHKQTVLLMNRRGYHTFVSCCNCKKVMSCPSCSISLTYHSDNNRLMCHYCGYSVPFIETCPECGEKNIRYAGWGTQRLEEEISHRFPSAKVVRLDADSVGTKYSYEKILGSFAAHEYDILLGTQMIAKGHNFPDVTLVGVVNIDQQLNNDDFRAGEDVFDLLTQVFGRAGRTGDAGVAYMQTVVPDNSLIALASQQNYKQFYDNEIAIRRAMIYPPFCDICLVGFTGTSYEKVYACAHAFLNAIADENAKLSQALKMIILGPLPPRVPKVNNRFRQKLMIKCRNSEAFRGLLSRLLSRFFRQKEYGDVTVFADMNPMTGF